MSLTRKFHVYTKCLTRSCRKNSRRTSICVLFLLFFYTTLLLYLLNNSYESSKDDLVDGKKLKQESNEKINENHEKNDENFIIMENLKRKEIKMRPDDYALNFENGNKNHEKDSPQMKKVKDKPIKMRPDDYALNFKKEQNF